MRSVERRNGPYLGVAAMCFAAILIAVVAHAVVANAATPSPLIRFLAKPGEIDGFTLGKARVFRTATEVKEASGESLAKVQIRRYEAEGFVEAASVQLHGRPEPSARGISNVIEFETPVGAKTEMEAALAEEPDLKDLPGKGARYFTLRDFKVPGVPGAVGFAFMTNEAAKRFGIESGISKGFVVEGSCLLEIGIFRQASKQVVEPVVTSIQAVYRRTGYSCP